MPGTWKQDEMLLVDLNDEGVAALKKGKLTGSIRVIGATHIFRGAGVTVKKWFGDRPYRAMAEIKVRSKKNYFGYL